MMHEAVAGTKNPWIVLSGLLFLCSEQVWCHVAFILDLARLGYTRVMPPGQTRRNLNNQQVTSYH